MSLEVRVGHWCFLVSLPVCPVLDVATSFVSGALCFPGDLYPTATHVP